jgi:lysophospholipase L1-like esterase
MKKLILVTTINLTVAILSVSCEYSPPVESPPPDGDTLVVSFTYFMDDRFGRDDNLNEMLDLPNTCVYVHNLPPGGCASGPPTELPKFSVTFKGEGRILTYVAGKPLKRHEFIAETFKWEVMGPGIDGSLQHEQSDPEWMTSLQEGEYTVTLTVEGHFGDEHIAMNSLSKKIKVIDMLIVSIGDSYASGEGNPEMAWVVGYPDGPPKFEPVWADDGVSSGIPVFPNVSTSVGKDHYRSHRSTLAGPAQAALAIERAQPHSSVTFVSTAASGATINEGLLNKYDGAEDPFQLEDMDAQIDQIKDLVGNRTIDYLFISVGGNDVGFSNIITSLILHGGAENPVSNVTCLGDDHPDRIFCLINAAFHSGNWNLVEDSFLADPILNLKNTSGLDALESNLFSNLNHEIDKELNVDAIWITPYPHPFLKRGNDGQLVWCPQMLAGITSAGKIDRNEMEWALENVLRPLNRVIHAAAEDFDWHYVDDIDQRFKGHGICLDEPYAPVDYPGNPYPSSMQSPTNPNVRWFRRASESEVIQGGSRVTTTGTMHPNEFGHLAIGEELSELIIELLNSFNPP